MGQAKQSTKYVKSGEFGGNQFSDAFTRHKSCHDANLQGDEPSKGIELEEVLPSSWPRPFSTRLVRWA